MLVIPVKTDIHLLSVESPFFIPFESGISTADLGHTGLVAHAEKMLSLSFEIITVKIDPCL